MQKNTWLTVFGIVLGLGTYFVLRLGGIPMKALLGTALFAAIFVAFGWVIGWLLAKDADVDGRLSKLIACGALVTWLIPAMGYVMSSVLWQFHLRSSENRLLFAAASTFVGVLALGNALYAVAVPISSP